MAGAGVGRVLRVLVADDHGLVRRGLRHILEEDLGSVAVDEACDAAEVLARVNERDYDVILLDVAMPGRSGLEILGEITARQPAVRVLVLSMFPPEQLAERALRGGAAGYLDKDSEPAELVAAVRALAAGGSYFDKASEALALAPAETGRTPHQRLSDRELQVMLRLAAGMTVGRIADEMQLSVKTVSTYRSRMLEKMGMRTNADVMQYAVRNKLLR